MSTKPKACCIVDPYVSSAAICDALIAKDILPVAILTNELKLSEQTKNNRFQKEKFAKILDFTVGQDISQLTDALSEFDVMAIIAGNERTCHISDYLAARLTPAYSNPETTSAMRVDKFEMHEGICRAGLEGIRQVRVTSAELTADEKQSLLQLQFPVIVKPTNQSGSIGVEYCQSLTEVQAALAQIMGKTSHYGNDVDACIVQEYVVGDEHFVDTVSYAGQHKIANVFRYHKIIHNNRSVYRYVEAIELHTPEAILCMDYVKKVLSALQLNYGMAHTEFFLTKAGPRLMELNPRVSGAQGLIANLATYTAGANQCDYLAQSLVDSAAFLSTVNDISPLKSHGKIVFLNTWHTRTLNQFHDEKVKKLPSYKFHRLTKKLGDQIHPPKELSDIVVMVLLVHTDEAQLKKDYDELMELEKKDLIFG